MAEVRGFRSKEKSQLAVVGEHLFYRSPNIAPAAAIVLSCKYLLEVGQVYENGRGTFASADLSAIGFGVKAIEEDKEAEGDGEEKKEEEKESRETLEQRIQA